MRIVEMEKPLERAISSYIREVYHYQLLEGAKPPGIQILNDEQFRKHKVGSFKGFYDCEQNLIVLNAGPTILGAKPSPKTICHEIEHWGQCQIVGKIKYLEQLQDVKTFFEYEMSADAVALANWHKLKW